MGRIGKSILLLLILILPSLDPTVFALSDYGLEIIAQTGQQYEDIGVIEDLGWGPSINDSGEVAFTARIRPPEQGPDTAIEGVFVSSGDSIQRRSGLVNDFYYNEVAKITHLDTGFSFGDVLQINNQSEIVWRARSHDNLFSFILQLGSTSDSFKIIAKNYYPRLDFPELESKSPFYSTIPADALLPEVTLNNGNQNQSRAVFSGLLKDMPSATVLSTPVNSENSGHESASDYNFSAPISGRPIFFPMVADNNYTIVRGGATPTAPLTLFVDETLSTAIIIAATNIPEAISNEFTAIGQRPGISDDGRVIVFVAEHKTQGVGIFMSARKFIDENEITYSVPEKIVGSQSGFSFFDLNSRVGVNRSNGTNPDDFTIAFLAKKTNNLLGLYAAQIVDIKNNISPIVTEPTLLIDIGDKIEGLTGGVKNIDHYDPINNSGQIIFWVETESEKAIIRATIQTQLSCIDPLKQYKDNGTDCVYRRGNRNHFNIEFNFPNASLSITEPEQPNGTVGTGAKVVASTKSPRKTIFEVEIPDNNPVGIYTLSATANIYNKEIKKEIKVYIIFDIPKFLRKHKDEVRAYLYDEKGVIDERSYHFNKWSISLLPAIIKFNPFKKWFRSWDENSYELKPFDKKLFNNVITAVNGYHSESLVANNLMGAVNNLFIYSQKNVNGKYDVPEMFSNVKESDFHSAYNGNRTGQVQGQCLDYANGLTALLRTIGIPSRVATKIEADKSTGFDYHQWTEAYLDSPDYGTDHWYIYDAMYGSGTRALGNGPPTDYTESGFGIVVGGTNWEVNGGAVTLERVTNKPNMVTLRRSANTEITNTEALFEKCENGTNGYAPNNCEVDPPIVDSLLNLNIEKLEFSVGETVSTTVSIENTENFEQSFSVSTRFFTAGAGVDGRNTNGDPVLGIPGTGMLGTTLVEETEAIVVPANSTIERVYKLLIKETFSPLDVYGVESKIIGDTLLDYKIVSFMVKPTYEFNLTIPTDAMVDDIITITAQLQNKGNFDITNLNSTLFIPDFYDTTDSLTYTVDSLNVGSDVVFNWTLTPARENIPTLEHFRIQTTSDNGGNQDEVFFIHLNRSPMPLIQTPDRPSDVLNGESFQVDYEVENIGSFPLVGTTVEISLPPELSTTEPLTKDIGDLLPGEITIINWTLKSEVSGVHLVTITVSDNLDQYSDTHVQLVVAGEKVIVPGVEGLLQKNAETAIIGAGLEIGNVTHQNSSTIQKGYVISQLPVAGTDAITGSFVDLVVSSGATLFTVPDLNLLFKVDAETAIIAAGLVVGTVTEQYSDTASAGIIISQNPPTGERVTVGTPVDFVISLGPEPKIATPQNLQTTPGNEQVSIAWDVVDGAISYNIYWNTTGNVSTVDNKITEVKSPFTHSGLTNDTTYYYIVTGEGTTGESAPSIEVAATPSPVKLISDIAFADTNLANCVNSLGLTYADEVTSLDCSNQNISNLAGIEAITNLTSLSLVMNNISDVRFLASLFNLTWMALQDNSITTGVPNLVTLTNATDINLSGNNNILCSDIDTLVNALGTEVITTPDSCISSLNDGLLAYWTFDNCDATDETGNGYNGTLSGGPGCVDGVLGKALDFDSVNDHIRLNQTVNPNEMKSLSFWINSRGVDGVNELGTVIAKYNWGGRRSFLVDSFDLFDNRIRSIFYSDGVSYNGDYLNSYYQDSTSLDPDKFTIINNEELGINTWKHVVINVTDKEIETWVDGQITNKTKRDYQQYFNSSEPTYIGNAFYIGSDFVYNYRLNGALDDFRIYSRPLSESEIGTLAESNATLVIVPNVVGISQSEAELAIINAGLTVGSVTTLSSSQVPVGTVIDQNPPPGAEVRKESLVDLVISVPPIEHSLTTEIGRGADSLVQSSLGSNNAANKNFGAETIVTIKNDTGLPGNSRKGYVRFDISNVAGTIESIQLDLTYAGTSPDPAANPSIYYVYGLNDGHAGEGWDETAITWNNAPGNDVNSTGGALTSETTLLGSFNVSYPTMNVGDVMSFSSPEIINFLNSDTDGLITLIITRQQRNFSIEYFASKEHETLSAPRLQISTSATAPLKTIVPDLTANSQDQAESIITNNNLILGTVSNQNSPTIPAGYVISQHPAPGTEVPIATPIDLIISSGLGLIKVPDLVGLLQADAEAAITNNALNLGEITTQESSSVPAGHIIRQFPAAGEDVMEGEFIDLVVSSGPSVVEVPNFIGLLQADAESAIRSISLVVGTIIIQESATVPSGYVLSQTPPEGSVVNNGSLVNLLISVGPIDIDPVTKDLKVSIGGTNQFLATIKNSTSTVKEYTLTVEGLSDPAWYDLSHQSISLLAGEEKQISLDIHIPEDCGIDLRDYPVNIRVTSTESGISHVLEGTLTVVQNPILENILPEDEERMAANDLLFSWRSDAPGTTEVFFRNANDAEYSHTEGEPGLVHSAKVDYLAWDSLYEWVVQTRTLCGSSQSELRRSFIDSGIVFDGAPYEYTIQRDYAQIRQINVHNRDNTPHELVVTLINENSDLIASFIGEGSSEQAISLGPNESKAVDIAYHAQDAEKDLYNVRFKITADLGSQAPIVSYADAKVNVYRPVFNLSIEEVSQDPFTLTNTFRLTNLGDPITDINVFGDAAHQAYMIITPSVQHLSLGSGESVEFSVLAEGEFDATITASGAEDEVSIATHFGCEAGTQPLSVSLDQTNICSFIKGSYCTNKPSIQIPFKIPEGIEETDILSAGLHADLRKAPGWWYFIFPHDVEIKINRNPVLSLRNLVPRGTYSQAFPPFFLNFAETGSASNTIQVETKHLRGGHFVVAGNFTVGLKLDSPFETMVCATDDADAQIKAELKLASLTCDTDFDTCPRTTQLNIVDPETAEAKNIFLRQETVGFEITLMNPEQVDHSMNLRLLVDDNLSDSNDPVELAEEIIVPANSSNVHLVEFSIPESIPDGRVMVAALLEDGFCQQNSGYAYSFVLITDSDGDGLPDSSDNCQNNVDCDGDGVVDGQDACPETPVGGVSDAAGCSQDQRDLDGDGTENDQDFCPDTPPDEFVEPSGCSDSQRDSDDDGAVDNNDMFPNNPAETTDSDGDGVGNNADLCDDTPTGKAVDSSGCPLVEIPNIEGLPLDHALAALEEAGLEPGEITPECSSSVLVSGVISQMPAAGNGVPMGSKVNFTLPVKLPQGTTPVNLVPIGRIGETQVFSADLTGMGLTQVGSITLVDDGTPFGGAPGIFSGFDVDAVFMDEDGNLNTFDDQHYPYSYEFKAGSIRPVTDPALQPNSAHPGPTFGSIDGITIDQATATLDQIDAINVVDVNIADGVLALGDGGTLTAMFAPEVPTGNSQFLIVGEVGGQVGEKLINACIGLSEKPTTGTIKIIKAAQPADGTDFSFTGSAGIGDFRLDSSDLDDDDNIVNSIAISSLPAGDYSVVESVPSGWRLDNVVCSGGDTDLLSSGATIHLGPGEQIACTFNNVIKKQIFIDIKPGSDINPINLGSKGVVPVAILGSANFDVMDVLPDTLAFGPDETRRAHKKGPHYEDVNADGFTDLVAHFRTAYTGIKVEDTQACLKGTIKGSIEFEACDEVRIVPNKNDDSDSDSDSDSDD